MAYRRRKRARSALCWLLMRDRGGARRCGWAGRADAARALALLDELTLVEHKTVVSPTSGLTTKEMSRTVEATVPMGDSWYSTTVDDDAALAAASAELRALAEASASGRLGGDCIAAVYRRHGVWR